MANCRINLYLRATVLARFLLNSRGKDKNSADFLLTNLTDFLLFCRRYIQVLCAIVKLHLRIRH